MKKILLIVLLLISTSVLKAQNYEQRIDSLKNDITLIQNNLKDVKYNLRLCDKQFQEGTYIFAGGFLMVLSSFAIKDKEGNINIPLLVIGGVAQLVGVVDMWQSHSYLGEAGK